MQIFKIISRRLSKARKDYATVAAKQDRDAEGYGRDSGGHGGQSGNRRYGSLLDVCHITFEFADRTSTQLVVPRRVYESLTVGSSGVLFYTLDSFREFRVENLARDSKL